ncbi:hypothetical protein CLV59_103661 [Chitinophaga dinghuensis]|uniref:Uncharacterized protein n=1 Tax=Chitinophaga dinghuensis TaxID=1539050 RepID=A0A327W353_9BACT|nr:hypothetical protein [Chitinophaga dinghuensis]RAJ83689.1 hypothetical protein CLV59_103661 [Chitinophaga dinghuensis]
MANPPIVDIPLLKYATSTDPDTLVINDPLDPQRSKVIIEIPATPGIKCKVISVSIPVGDSSDTLFSLQTLPSCGVNNTDWALSSNNLIGHLSGMNEDQPDNAENFLIEHMSDDKTVNTPVTITIEGSINGVIGTAVVKVTELSTTADNETYQVREYYKELTKAGKPAFYLNSFVALNPDISGHPVSAIPKMKPFQMEWQSNGDTFRIFMDGSTAPLTTTSNKYYPFPRGLTRDANFILEASKNGKILYQQLSVTCADSDFNGGYIHAAGDVTIEGYTNFNGQLTMHQPMTCNGTSTFHETMYVDKLQINDTAMAVQKLTCARGLEVSQETKLQSTTISGNLTVTGHITANGGVNRSADKETWTAPQKLDKKIKYFGTELGILPGSFHLDLV